MNYYPHHLGDYAIATAHLTWDEDQAYTRLIRAYYTNEAPIPADLQQVYRICRASTDAQKAAIEVVLHEFFVLQDDGWHQTRCDSEIQRFQNKSEKASKSAQLRWDAMRTHSEGNANALETHSEGNANHNHNHNQKNTHKPESNLGVGDLLGDSYVASKASDLPACPHQKVVDMWNELMPELPKVRSWNADRQRLLKARWAERGKAKGWKSVDEGLAFFRKFFEYIRKSDFLMGKTTLSSDHASWSCSLPWVLEASKFAKIIDGEYHSGASNE